MLSSHDRALSHLDSAGAAPTLLDFSLRAYYREHRNPMCLLRQSVLLLLLFPWQSYALQDFTDDSLRRTLAQESRVLFYTFSTAMPLSVEGLQEIRNAAADLRASVVFLADPLSPAKDLAKLSAEENLSVTIRLQKSAILKDLGIQLHYPSVVVSNNHRVVGPPIQGYKSRAGYVTLVSDLLNLAWTETYNVTQTVKLPRPMNSFFKPVYGTDLILSGNASPNYLLNLKTGATYDIPNSGWGDPGASPDREFVTLLGMRGLNWYALSDILSTSPSVLVNDPGLITYQSMGLLPDSSTYRVVGAESSSTNPTGLRFRDHTKVARPGGGVTIRANDPWTRLCEGRRIAIPMMSKTGLYLSGSHEGVLKVFRIGEAGDRCDEVFNSAMVTGKADFSADDRSLTFVSRTDDPVSHKSVDAVFIADLEQHRTKPIYFGSESSPLFFPGFLDEDRLVVYDQTSQSILLLERSRRIQ